MASLLTIVNDVRYKVRDIGENQYADAEVLSAVNNILEEIHADLMGIESNYVYGHSTISLVDGTKEYTPGFTHKGFMHRGVWLDGYDYYLEQRAEPERVAMGREDDSLESIPDAYYFTESGDVGFIDTPDTSYTCHVYYWAALTAMTDIDTDVLPWNGVWNQFIKRRLIMDLLERQERNIAIQSVLADIEYNKAMQATLNHGVRQHIVDSDFFDIDEI